MREYPSIPGSSGAPHKPCYAFYKYDGSNIRCEWSKKRGWYKFGTRTQMIDETDPIFGRAVPLFKQKYGDELIKVFKSEKTFYGINHVVVFAEFFGSKSFAGMHFPDDPKWDIVLFDVNPHRKGILGPKEFVDLFGHLPIAEHIYTGNMNKELIENVRKEKMPIVSNFEVKAEIPEGVICKGTGCLPHKGWSCKIKTERYRNEIMNKYRADWEKYWE